MGVEQRQTLVIIQAAIGSAVVFDEVMNLVTSPDGSSGGDQLSMATQGIRAMNGVMDEWEVDDDLAFELQMTSCGLHRPIGSV